MNVGTAAVPGVCVSSSMNIATAAKSVDAQNYNDIFTWVSSSSSSVHLPVYFFYLRHACMNAPHIELCVCLGVLALTLYSTHAHDSAIVAIDVCLC